MIRYIWIGFCLSILLSACQSSVNEPKGHLHEEGGHAHGENGHDDHATVSLTLYSDETELFVEFSPLMIGHVSKFVTHLTNLESYKPYSEGKVTVSLIKGKKGIRETVDKPEKEGIFTPSLLPKAAGNHTLIFDIESKYGKERFSVNNIRVYKDHQEAETDMAANVDDNNATSFLKEQAWKIEFGTSEVKSGPFQEIIKTTGSLMPSVRMEKRVVAQSNGIVRFQSNDIVAGKTVQKGDPIFNLSSEGLADHNISTQFVEAKTELEKAKSEFDRAKTLREDLIVSEKDFIEARSNYETAKTKFNSINKNFSQRGLLVSSPVNGYLCDIYVDEGQYVERGTVLAKVDKGSKLLLKADVYQKHLQQAANVKSANFRLPYNNKVYETNDLNGRLVAFGKDIHEEDYTTPLYFEIDKTPELYPGSFVEVYLKSEKSVNVLNIEKSAILEGQGLKYVFVQTGGESFEKRFVTIGTNNGREVEITSGLQAGERVVSKGAYFVKLASLSGALPAHSHDH